MDEAKRRQLIRELGEQLEPQLVPIEQFFDGNDDEGSIAPNLHDHPGVEVFRSVLTGLLHRPDVDGVYAQIDELDPGEGCWPFSTTVLVLGRLSGRCGRTRSWRHKG